MLRRDYGTDPAAPAYVGFIERIEGTAFWQPGNSSGDEKYRVILDPHRDQWRPLSTGDVLQCLSGSVHFRLGTSVVVLARHSEKRQCIVYINGRKIGSLPVAHCYIVPKLVRTDTDIVRALNEFGRRGGGTRLPLETDGKTVVFSPTDTCNVLRSRFEIRWSPSNAAESQVCSLSLFCIPGGPSGSSKRLVLKVPDIKCREGTYKPSQVLHAILKCLAREPSIRFELLLESEDESSSSRFRVLPILTEQVILKQLALCAGYADGMRFACRLSIFEQNNLKDQVAAECDARAMRYHRSEHLLRIAAEAHDECGNWRRRSYWERQLASIRR